MSDLVGQMILHYNIIEEVGQGGMGIVYRAEDCKLNRQVALKILPAHLLVSKEDRGRFKREAKAAASLNHPNIAIVHETNEYDSKPFIVMEFVEGATLDLKIANGPLKLKEAVSFAVQIAEGLEAAHKKNIVHRDIKASNILISDENKVKILDFGLAKSALDNDLTRGRTIIGTVGYMSPEQVRGDNVDHRSDLWSMGIVLYEMISGQLPFKGEYSQAVFYSIENEEHEPLTAIRSLVPMSLEWVVAKLLAKDPDSRYQSARECIIDLKSVDLSETSPVQATQTHVPETEKIKSTGKEFFSPSFTKTLIWFFILLTAFFTGWYTKPENEKSLRKFEWKEDWDIIEISPDGRKLAYTRGEDFWVRSFNKLDPAKIESNEIIQYPFMWSPDSREIAFFVNSNNTRQLRKASVNGGPSILISNMDDTYHPCFWGKDDSLVFIKDNTTFFKMSSTGGKIIQMYQGDTVLSHIKQGLETAYSLPAKDAILMAVNTAQQNEIIVQDKNRRKTVYSYPPDFEIADAVYSKSGHIVFHRWATNRANHPDLWGLEFDVASFEVYGEPFLISANAGYPDVTEDGTLFYGKVNKVVTSERLVRLDRSGAVTDSIGAKHFGVISAPKLSKDQKKIILYGSDRNESGIWLHQENKKTLILKGENAWSPVFSADDKAIYFTDVRENSRNIYYQKLGSIRNAERINNTALRQYLPRLSTSGQYIIFTSLQYTGNFDLSYQAMGNNEVHSLLKTGNDEQYGAMSPDNNFLIFQSDKSGRDEIYASLFNDLSVQHRISDNGGKHPVWIADEIFYSDLHNDLMVVKVAVEGTDITFDAPQMLFSGDIVGVRLNNGFQVQKYTVSSDGQSVIAVHAPQALEYYMVLVENWFEEFKNN